MLKITVEGNKEETRIVKDILDSRCVIGEKCQGNITCEECEKTRLKIEYVVKEDK